MDKVGNINNHRDFNVDFKFRSLEGKSYFRTADEVVRVPNNADFGYVYSFHQNLERGWC